MISNQLTRDDLLKFFSCDKKELAAKIKEEKHAGRLLHRVVVSPEGKRTTVYHVVAEQSRLF